MCCSGDNNLEWANGWPYNVPTHGIPTRTLTTNRKSIICSATCGMIASIRKHIPSDFVLFLMNHFIISWDKIVAYALCATACGCPWPLWRSGTQITLTPKASRQRIPERVMREESWNDNNNNKNRKYMAKLCSRLTLIRNICEDIRGCRGPQQVVHANSYDIERYTNRRMFATWVVHRASQCPDHIPFSYHTQSSAPHVRNSDGLYGWKFSLIAHHDGEMFYGQQ